ncbi:MAG TPA: hypothetical protein VNO70_11990 [Blastocatellia bacterium]|nr:hypothetical protein [Blastocatellia bacterium]
MASAVIAVQEDRRDVIAQKWIINRRDDLLWFIGSVAASYALLVAYLGLGVPVMFLVWVWALGFDGPHVFATVSRTYADSEERRNRARLLYGSLLLFLLGPTMVLAGRANLLGTDAWGPLFFLFASLWAYYHLVKQHYGFMILYKKKNDDLAEIDNLIDRAFLLLGMTYPLLHFMGNSAAAAGRVPFSTQTGFFWWLQTLVLSGFVVTLILFVARQAQRLYLRLPINAPKLLLLAAALPMHWIVLRLLEPKPEGAIASVAMLTIYHNLQYHRIVWFHNENKYRRAGAPSYGAATFISKTMWRYIGLALLFGALYHIPHYTIVAPGGLVMAFIWGGAFTHYYLDSKIWRVRRDAQLNHNLRMAQPQKAGDEAAV